MIPVLIVLYEPESSQLSRIAGLQNHANLYIFDNSAESHARHFLRAHYQHAAGNRGITGALLWVLEVASGSGMEHILFFDQDTVFDLETLTSIEQTLGTVDHRAGVVHFKTSPRRIGPVRFAINSGSVFRVAPLRQIQAGWSRYFVDAVDLAICHELRAHGFLVVQREAPGIDHVIGQGFQTIRFAGRAFQVKRYSAWRRRSFMRAHVRLLIQCLRHVSLADAAHILRFIVYFAAAQRFGDLLVRYGQRA